MSITVTIQEQVTEVDVVSEGTLAVSIIEQPVAVSVAYGLSDAAHAALHPVAVVDSSAWPVDHQLPSAWGMSSYTVINAGTHAVTVLPYGAETIDGDTYLIVEDEWSAVTLYAQNGAWYVG